MLFVYILEYIPSMCSVHTYTFSDAFYVIDTCNMCLDATKPDFVACVISLAVCFTCLMVMSNIQE